MMTEFDEPCSRVYGAFKLFVDKLIHIPNLLYLKRTEYVGYDIVQSYESIFLS